MTSELNADKFAVLFVDDEENVLKSLTRLFLDESFTILTAGSGQAGLEVLKEHPVAVIVSDQKMPGMIGAEFLAKSCEIQPDAVRMILTGYADVSAAMDAINKGGAFRYITKPWNDEDLVHAVHDALDRYCLAAENRRLTALTIQQNDELKKWGSELELYVQQQTIDLTKRNKELQLLTERQQKTFREMITAFLGIIELRDTLLFRHSRQVAALVGEMVKVMKLERKPAEMVKVAAQLHDIGALRTPDMALLKNPKDMSQDDVREFFQHPVRGQAIVTAVEEFRDVGLCIRHHHELYNGTGFPDRLAGEAIPLGARIIAMADKCDWMMHRTAQDERAIDGMLGKITGMLRVQLDPDLYEALAASVRSVYMKVESQEETIEAELPCDRLEEGMTVIRDIRSGTGLLLLSKGVVLTAKTIGVLQRYHAVDPLKTGILVAMKVKT